MTDDKLYVMFVCMNNCIRNTKGRTKEDVVRH